jgi:hypothetical protein
VVLSNFSGTVQIGPRTLTSMGATDIFVARLDGATGEPEWVQQIGGTGEEEGLALAVDPGRPNIVVGGQFEGTVSIGKDTLVSGGLQDAFIALFSGSDGLPIWSTGLGGSGTDGTSALALTPGGDVVAAGRFSTGMLTKYVVKLSQGNGDVLFEQKYTATGFSEVLGVAVDPEGRIHVTGSFDGTFDLGLGAPISSDYSAAFLATLSPAGAPLGATLFRGEDATVFARGLCMAGSDRIVTIGELYGTASFGGNSLSAAGNSDV